ncbi:hypothetical protein WA026_002647 [Henosepilachna vigintioctopunctata]|uniref:PAS domain-containing protein n=1 Tax=Henosepilachna vigintioctopunctata TaxID=420089 RepID=A0AAW1TU24_9CUCU
MRKGISYHEDRSFLVGNIRDGTCHIIYCSDGFCRLTGYSRAEVMQRPASCEFLCGPLTSQQAVTSLREALQEGVEKHAEILYYRKDGLPYYYGNRISGSLFDNRLTPSVQKFNE